MKIERGGVTPTPENSAHKGTAEGFTMIEIMVVVALIVIVGVVSFLALQGRRGTSDLTNTTSRIAALLREAESRAMAQSMSVGWGVHFENGTSTAPFYALFSSSTYSAATRESYYALPVTLQYTTSSFASGATKDIVFSQITGAPSASWNVTLSVVGNAAESSTITIASSGLVSY